MRTITEFVEEMKKNENMNIEEELSIRKYIPFAEKKAIIEDIIDRNSGDEDGYFHCDRVQMDADFAVSMVKYHTGLDIGDIDEDYDSLLDELDSNRQCDLNLIRILYAYYGEDYEICHDMLEMMLKDREKQTSIEASLGALTKSVSNGISSIADAFHEGLSQLGLDDILPEGMDLDEAKKLFKEFLM